MNKKLGIFALAMLILGAGSSIAIQSFADVQPATNTSATVTTQADQNIDQKDAQGNDLETNDDSKATLGARKESAHDNDSDAQSEQNENDSTKGGEVDQGE